MGVLDIYGFEIFEVRPPESHPPMLWLYCEDRLWPTTQKKGFAWGCLRAHSGTCEELIIAYYGLIKPHLDQISSALSPLPPGKKFFSANVISALKWAFYCRERRSKQDTAGQYARAHTLLLSHMYLCIHTGCIFPLSISLFGQLCVCEAIGVHRAEMFPRHHWSHCWRAHVFFTPLLVHPLSLTNPPSPLPVMLSGSPGRSK